MQELADGIASEDARRREEENVQLAALIASAAGGSIEAFEALYDRTARRLLAHVRRRVGEDHAEDVLTEVFLQVWGSLADFDAQRAPAMGWLRMIANSRAVDHLRRRQREERHVADGKFEVQDLPDPVPGPEQQCARGQERSTLHRLLAGTTLSRSEREVIGLAYFGDSTQQEIAASMCLPLGTVKTTMSRAQDKLRAGFAALAA